jgi:hypothetical protein
MHRISNRPANHNTSTDTSLHVVQSSETSFSDETEDEGTSDVTDYSDQIFKSSNQLVEGDPELQAVLTSFGLAVAKRVLHQLQMVREKIGSFRTQTASGGISSYSKTTGSTDSGSTSQPSKSTGKRLRRDNNSSPPGGDGSGDDSNKRRKAGEAAPDPILLRRKFACPFYKRNPGRNQRWRSCAGPGWDSIHRLKYDFTFWKFFLSRLNSCMINAYYYREHIYRRHQLPITCPRCGKPFENEHDMHKHSKDPIPCQVSEPEETEGYNKEQEKQLRGRKKPPNQTEEERWFEKYIILFPKDDHSSIPSPCKH